MDTPSHPGARALRRTMVLLVLFTTPAVLTLMGVIPEPQNPPGAPLALMMGWIMVGLIGKASSRPLIQGSNTLPLESSTMLGRGLLDVG